MDLTIQECQFLVNSLNVQATAGFADGLNGSQQALVLVAKLQNYANTLNQPDTAPPVEAVPAPTSLSDKAED